MKSIHTVKSGLYLGLCETKCCNQINIFLHIQPYHVRLISLKLVQPCFSFISVSFSCTVSHTYLDYFYFSISDFFLLVSSCYFYTFLQSSYPASTLTLFTYSHPACWFGFSPFPLLLGHSSLCKLNAIFQTSLAPNLNFSSFPCPSSCIYISFHFDTCNVLMDFVLIPLHSHSFLPLAASVSLQVLTFHKHGGMHIVKSSLKCHPFLLSLLSYLLFLQIQML